MRPKPVPVLMLLVLFALPTAAATIHVPGDQPTIQAGIDAAFDGDAVLVADGTYTGPGNRDIDFLGKAITVRSENGAESCIVDGGDDGRGFIFQSGETVEAVLQGFTVTNGTEVLGGAIYCVDSETTLRDMVISNCHATVFGGGICCENGALHLSDSVIDGCLADKDGGGIHATGSSLTISNSSFTGNAGTGQGHMQGDGGGVACIEGILLEITDTTLQGNLAGAWGGGVYCDDTPFTFRNCLFDSNQIDEGSFGSAARAWSSLSLEITGCTFTGNIAGGSSTESTLYCSAESGEISDNLITGNSGLGINCWGGLMVTRNTISDNTGGRGIQTGGTIWDTTMTVTENTITGNEFGGMLLYGPTLVTNNEISDNNGSGISCWGDRCTISDNLISGNSATDGGGIRIYDCESTIITDNVITGNSASREGGGIHIGADTQAICFNNLVVENSANHGGGIACEDSFSQVWNMTCLGNTAGQGGGVYTYNMGELSIVNSIIWGNTASEGNQIHVGNRFGGVSRLNIRYSDVQSRQNDVRVDPGCTLNWWEGMIGDDPLFTTGPQGDYYLSHVQTGHAFSSPCINAGDPATSAIEGTTRVDGIHDVGLIDMGYHYPLSDPGSTALVIAALGPGPDNPSRIRVFLPKQDSNWIFAYTAYDGSRHGAILGSGDLDGDGGDELLTGPGPNEHYGPHVRGFEVHGNPLPGLSYLAYGTHKYGVNVTAGDLDADGYDEVITGPGPGVIFGPHVRGWNYDDSGMVTSMPGVSFFAYGTPKWGVNVASGDIDGDGYDEIVTGAGPGPIYGAHVRGWNVDGGTAGAIPQISYFAYNTARMGVRVSCGDIDGDGMDEIVTAPGPSEFFPAHIRGWNYDGTALAAMPGVNFLAWPADGYRHGASIHAGADLDGDGRAELVVGPGPDPAAPTEVRVYGVEGGATLPRFSLQAFPESWVYGASVAAGRF